MNAYPVNEVHRIQKPIKEDLDEELEENFISRKAINLCKQI